MNILRSTLLSRRHLLRGSVAALGLPFLEAMLPMSSASAAVRKLAPVSAATNSQPRVIYIYHSLGVHLPAWTPKGEGKDFELHGTLETFKPFQDDLTVVSGLANPRSKGGHAVGDTWLTCADLTSVPGKEYQNSISIDQLIANKIGVHTRYPSIQVSRKGGTGGANSATTVAFNNRGAPMPCENRPERLFDRLFTNPTATSAEETKREFARRRSLLDDVLVEAKALEQKLGKNDRQKLEEYLDSVRNVEKRVHRLEDWIDKPKPKIEFDRRGVETEASPSSTHDRDMWYDAMMDLAYLAFASDATRVFTFGAEWGHNFDPNHHDYSHHGGDAEKIRALEKVDRWHSDFVSRLVTLLKNTPDGEGSMLDNTLVVYGSGAGRTHHAWDLPCLLVGGKNLGITQGRHFALDPEKRTTVANLHLSTAQAFGIETSQFGDSTGTLAGLL